MGLGRLKFRIYSYTVIVRHPHHSEASKAHSFIEEAVLGYRQELGIESIPFLLFVASLLLCVCFHLNRKIQINFTIPRTSSLAFFTHRSSLSLIRTRSPYVYTNKVSKATISVLWAPE
jgi:hypothetical protein